jgi:aspartate 4-decarboxylase
MSLFSLYCLIDKKGEYKRQAQDIVKTRFKILYNALGVAFPETPLDAHYYTTIDIPVLAENRYSKDFSDYLVRNHEPIDFVVKLAEEKSIVLMDGGGFDSPNMSVRVSLANLPDSAYETIGKEISNLLEEYYQKWISAK